MPYARAVHGNSGRVPGDKLFGLGRCPHCSVAAPNVNVVWHDNWVNLGEERWAAYRCNSCSSVMAAKMRFTPDGMLVTALFPDAKSVHEDVPEPARTFLQQAYETLHAPDAAAVMAGSAVDAMLKQKGYDNTKLSLYARIDQALADNVLTKGMAEWAHAVRLGSNRPRHADKEKPHVSADEAKQSVDFAEALGNFLFVLTARIDRGIKAAEAPEPSR